MAISTIKTGSRVIVKDTGQEVTVDSISRGIYTCNKLGYSASEIKLIPNPAKELKRTPLKQSTKPLKRTPLKQSAVKIRQVSKHRQKEISQYSKQREAFLNKHTECQAKLKNCSLLADEVHHRAGRSGDLLLDETKWLPICHGCHVIITEQSKMAIETGLSLPRNT